VRTIGTPEDCRSRNSKEVVLAGNQTPVPGHEPLHGPARRRFSGAERRRIDGLKPRHGTSEPDARLELVRAADDHLDFQSDPAAPGHSTVGTPVPSASGILGQGEAHDPTRQHSDGHGGTRATKRCRINPHFGGARHLPVRGPSVQKSQEGAGRSQIAESSGPSTGSRHNEKVQNTL
jgi:hypothetical protein